MDRVKTEKSRKGEISCSVEETNRLREKLGLKPLKVEPTPQRTKQVKAVVTKSKGEVSCSIEETNRIRAELGLKPLRVSGSKDSAKKPVVQNAGLQKEENDSTLEIKARIELARKKRKLKEKLKGPTLGEGESSSALDWIKKASKKQDAALKALEREKQYELLESAHAEEAAKYDSNQLAGIKITHDISNFKAGEEVIMTLKDTSVLDEENNTVSGAVDELENVNMVENDRAKKRAKIQEKITRSKMSYAGLEEEYDERGNPIEKQILDKYDFEDNLNRDEAAHVLNAHGMVTKTSTRNDKEGKNKFQSVENEPKSLLDVVHDNLYDNAEQDYLSKEEQEKLLGKKKKKVKKKKKMGKKKRKNREKKDRSLREAATVSDLMDGDDNDVILNQAGKESTTVLRVDEDDEPDDMGLQDALLKARRAINRKKQSDQIQNVGSSPAVTANVFKSNYLEASEDKGTVFTSAMQFSSAIESNMLEKQDDQENDMEVEVEETAKSIAQHAANKESASKPPGPQETKIDDPANKKDARKIFKPKGSNLSGGGMAAALAAFKSQGDIKASSEEIEVNKEHKKRKDRKQLGEDTKFDIDLTYRDENGKILTTKEAYVQMCYKFHGIKPGKNKIEKLRRREEQKKRVQNMGTGDTPLGTASALRKQTQKLGTAFVKLDDTKA